MNSQSAIRKPGSLLERAAEIYDFEAALRGTRRVPEPVAEAETAGPPEPAPEPRPQPRQQAQLGPAGPVQAIDREALRDKGFILPDAPVTGLAEEYRIVKRQLLAGIRHGAGAKERAVLVCSSQPDEGKTFSAVNLALSLASEKEAEVLLVDGDFPKPEILSLLGLEGKAGLVDALADASADPERFVIRTDIPGLSVLPAGRQENNVPELLAARTEEVIARLGERHPRRIILFDSPPVLMASSASALASHVGQAVLVVRADRTTEADLREAVRLLSGCERLSLLLNGAGFAATGRRFGAYYGYGR
jgi:protein-tyrosine kinase